MSSQVKRVLIVDDNVDSAELTADILRAHGLDVSVATCSLAALDIAPAFLPEVALLDIKLPEIDGYELARRITRLGIDCRLIAVTGYGSDRDRACSQAAGFAAHLTKPVTTARMLAAIAGVDPAAELDAARGRSKLEREPEDFDHRSLPPVLGSSNGTE